MVNTKYYYFKEVKTKLQPTNCIHIFNEVNLFNILEVKRCSFTLKHQESGIFNLFNSIGFHNSFHSQSNFYL